MKFVRSITKIQKIIMQKIYYVGHEYLDAFKSIIAFHRKRDANIMTKFDI